jgi:hypothetical protein
MGKMVLNPDERYTAVLKGRPVLLRRATDAKVWEVLSLDEKAEVIGTASDRPELEHRFGELDDLALAEPEPKRRVRRDPEAN